MILGERSIVQLGPTGKPLPVLYWHQITERAKAVALVCPTCWHDHHQQIRESCQRGEVNTAPLTITRISPTATYRCTYCQQLRDQG